ncbi:MAG: chemotaxis protein CheW [Spirochaetales bacterium]|jgi:purine-binding chemotaxis protein CheW|nr:chemotaxis protein CheW [Spirochaetales bacterium]
MSSVAGSLVLDKPEQEQKEGAERSNLVDFKMVTFSLGGKDYGIDIMKVKEIAKFSNFTYVPNSYPYVRGVYNLRGDIISILDLRILFHLPVPKDSSNTNTENGLILRLEENVLGVVVDSIDKVIGISSKDIQPPHPIFGDINIKYIQGVVENDSRLYIILNSESICAREEGARKGDHSLAPGEPGHSQQDAAPAAAGYVQSPAGGAEPERDFIRETLRTFRGFHVTPLNEEWFLRRFMEWKDLRQRAGADIQLKAVEDAEAYLSNFYSADTGRFWNENLAVQYSRVFGESAGKIINAWNVGCGRGYEAYSLAAILSKKYTNRIVKLWANDSDLIAISTAANLLFNEADVPEYLKFYVVTGKNGTGFQTDFKNKIFFEYHDALHSNTLPDLDIVVARDMLSFLSPENQQKLLTGFYEKLKPTGVLILGDNERPLDSSRWEPLQNARSSYKKS